MKPITTRALALVLPFIINQAVANEPNDKARLFFECDSETKRLW